MTQQQSGVVATAPSHPQPSAPPAADCAAPEHAARAGGRGDVKEIKAGGRKFHGYVKRVEEVDKKTEITTYVEVMPDGTEREFEVKAKKKKDKSGEACFWTAVLGFALFD